MRRRGFWSRLLCRLGLHPWEPLPSVRGFRRRRCPACGRRERTDPDVSGFAGTPWVPDD